MSTYSTTRASRGRPSTPAGSIASPEHIPRPVGLALSHLAHLIDDSLEVRGGAVDARSFAARSLGVGRDDVVVDMRPLSPVESVLVGIRLAALIEDHDVLGIIGEDADSSPVWSAISMNGEGSSRYPVEIYVAFAAGALAPGRVVIGIERTWQSRSLVGFSTPAGGGPVREVLDRVVAEAGAVSNPFRQRTVVADLEFGLLRLRVDNDLVGDRADVILPERIWTELDRHVLGVFRSQDRLAAAGLATNRGVLLHGPPGVGKSAAVRAVAASLAGEVTVVLCNSDVVTGAVGSLYGELPLLAPALVIIDDFDRIAPESGEPMRDLLTALDGVASRHQAVVTLATANSVARLDPAVRRSARFDAEIEVPIPERAARAEILTRYLRDIAADVDVATLARLTEGATGADLRDLATEAVLAAGSSPVSFELLKSLARGRITPVERGMYL
jgi:hypothetical protein